MNTMYVIVDKYGRSYFEGQTFSHDEALSRATQISPDERPYGVIIVSEDDE